MNEDFHLELKLPLSSRAVAVSKAKTKFQCNLIKFKKGTICSNWTTRFVLENIYFN